MTTKQLRWEMVASGAMTEGYAKSMDSRDNARERVVI